MEPGGQLDMQQLLAAAAAMQSQLMNAQHELAEAEIEGTAGGGLVRATSGSGLGAVPFPNAGAQQTLLILVMAAALSGTANSVREIVKERDIFERERMAGLSTGAYLFSKVFVLGFVSVLQTLIIIVIGLLGRSMPAHGAVIQSAFVEILVATAVLWGAGRIDIRPRRWGCRWSTIRCSPVVCRAWRRVRGG